MNILDETINLGESRQLNFNLAKLHTTTSVEVPVFVERANKPGPTVLFTAGIHGDEVNGVEIIRQLIAKGINKPKKGTIICIPILNIFGFLHKLREFPDGRDLNRVFPGSKMGSLAGRVAHHLMHDIIPHIDYCIDFHTGGSSRFNAAHIRIVSDNQQHGKLAEVFNAPFILHSKNIKRSFRSALEKEGIPILLFEGGKSNSIDVQISNTGVNGSKRVLKHLGMLREEFIVSSPKKPSVIITKSKWLRATQSGMFKPVVDVGVFVKRGYVMGHITDPYGKVNYWLRTSHEGYVINVNESPLIYQGDALFHISTHIAK